MDKNSLENQIDEDIKKHASEFIDEIESGEFKKIVLPNTCTEYPLEKALNSFNALTKSKITDEAIDKLYE